MHSAPASRSRGHCHVVPLFVANMLDSFGGILTPIIIEIAGFPLQHYSTDRSLLDLQLRRVFEDRPTFVAGYPFRALEKLSCNRFLGSGLFVENFRALVMNGRIAIADVHPAALRL
jgi:hypothetical protein